MADTDSDSDMSSDIHEEPYETEIVDLLTRLSDTLDDYTVDGGGDTASVSDILRVLSDIVVTYIVEYEKLEPDPYDIRHIERVMPDCPLAKIVKKIETDPELIEKIVDTVIMHGGEEESKAGALYLALVMPLLDLEDMVLQINDIVGFDDFLFEKVKQLNRRDREMPLYCLSILSHLLESRQQAQPYKEKIRELVSPLMKRCHELYVTLMRRLLRKQPPPGEFMGDFPLPKRSRTSGVLASAGACIQPIHIQPISVQTNGTSSASASAIGDSSFPSTSAKSRSDDQRTSAAAAAACGDGLPRSAAAASAALLSAAGGQNVSRNLAPELGQRGIPAILAGGLVSPQPTSEELSAEDRLRHDCALHPVSDTTELRIIAVALASVGYMPEVQGIFLPYALKIQMVSCLINLSSIYTRKKRWLLVVDCLKLVSQLVAHKKFALELVANGGIGVQLLLGIPPSSIASTAVMNVFSSLAENNKDTMERIYLILQSNSYELLDKLVSYCVDVLECGHNSARSTSGEFLMHSFSWPAVKECFDKHDGLRKLLNQVMTLSMMSNEDGNDMDEELQLTERQRVRDTLQTLQNYILANFTMVTKGLIVMVCNNLPSSSVGPDALRSHLLKVSFKLKEAIYGSKLTLDNVATFILYWPGLTKWSFVASLMQLGCVQLLLQLVLMSAKWKNSPLRLDVCTSSLECLAILALLQSDVRLLMCESFTMPDGSSHSAMNVLLEAAEGSLIDDFTVQTLALQILATCVSPDSAADHLLIVSGHDHSVRCGESYSAKLGRVWTCVRNHHGIRVLVQLIQKRTPMVGVDSLRSLACIALSGLSRCGEVKQILSKLPLFNSGQMLALMAEPVTPVKVIDHRVFCHFAQMLINNVAGKAATEAGDSTLSELQRAYVVGRTEISYPRQELLQIIYQHLVDEGLPTAALALQIEAKLPATPVALASSSAVTSSVPSTPNMFNHQTMQSPAPASGRTSKRMSITQSSASKSKPGSVGSAGSAGSVSSVASVASVSASPIIRPIVTPSSASSSTTHVRVGDNRRKEPLTVFIPPMPAQATQTESKQSLNKIVTHFLRDQHSKCAHPMAVCPPFSLSEGHQCPVPCFRRHAPGSLAQRIMRRQSMGRRHVGLSASAMNRQFIYSRYRPASSFEDPLDSFYSAVAFLPGDDSVVMGCHSGEICLGYVSKDRFSAQMDNEFECNRHQSQITSLVPSKSGRLMLSSSRATGPEQSLLWSVSGTNFTMKHAFDNAIAVEFANLSEDRLIATYMNCAKIHDTETGTEVFTLSDSSDNRRAGFNFASFHPSDDLVLSGGCLWDVRGPSYKSIRQFDSLNSFGCGLFHPKSGVEVIINSEIWDLRTFNLLSTCAQLDKCHLRFNRAGDVIFGVHQYDDSSASMSGTQESALQVVDGFTYQPIASVPMKKQLFDFNISWDDSCLAVVENYSDSDWINSGSDCRLYIVGQQRHWLNDMEDDEEDNGGGGGGDDSDDDSEVSDSDDSSLDGLDGDQFMFTSDEDGSSVPGSSDDGGSNEEDDDGTGSSIMGGEDDDDDNGEDDDSEFGNDEDILDALDNDDVAVLEEILRNGRTAHLDRRNRSSSSGGGRSNRRNPSAGRS